MKIEACRMIRLYVFFYILFSTFYILHSSAQELYPNTESASSITKGALGIRLLSESYNENGRLRNQFAIRLMYGVNSKLSVYIQPDINNHHSKLLPSNLLTHTHLSVDPNSPAQYSLSNKTF